MTRLETTRLIFRDHEPGNLEPYCEMESDGTYRVSAGEDADLGHAQLRIRLTAMGHADADFGRDFARRRRL